MKGFIPLCFVLAFGLIACKAQKVKKAEEQLEETNYIEMDLANKLDPNRMVIAFNPAYGLLYECIVDREENKVIYSFDKEKVSLIAILNDLRLEVGVEGAEASDGCVIQ